MKNTQKQLCILLLFLSTVPSFSQQHEAINTDRPDQSDGTYTVPKNSLQVENGFTIADKTYMYNLMLRYGISNSTEIRLLGDVGSEFGAKGIAPVSVSIKQRLLREQTAYKFIPEITFVAYASYEKIASSDFASNTFSTEYKLVFENKLSEQIGVGYNIGTDKEFEDLNLTTAFTYEPSETLLFYLEYFGTLSNEEDEHNIDAGVMYKINPLLQVDFALGRDIDAGNARLFGTFGISYRFDS